MWLAVAVCLLFIVIMEERTKREVRRLLKHDAVKLKIYYETKLGMWSPK